MGNIHSEVGQILTKRNDDRIIYDPRLVERTGANSPFRPFMNHAGFWRQNGPLPLEFESVAYLKVEEKFRINMMVRFISPQWKR